ncbi:MAG: YggT family protein [Desulfobacteraceae bacterium]|nr:YggT family protein [Desulfobacteraceae bacterium]
MFVLGYFLKAVALVLDYALTIYMWIVIAKVVLSWVNPDPYNPIVKIINSATDPVFYQIRKRMPVSFGMIDISPIIIILSIYFIQVFIVNSLIHLASTFVQL